MIFTQEDICIWFKDLQGHSRIELICTLFDICLPLELRFLGTYLEYYAGKHYTHLQKFEKDANNNEILNSFRNLLNEHSSRRLLCIFLALLHSHNRFAATKLYEILKTLDITEVPINKVSQQGEEKRDTDEEMEKAKLFSENEVKLLFTMASYHPAFEFLQRQNMREMLARIQNKKQKYIIKSQSVKMIDQETQTEETSDNGCSTSSDCNVNVVSQGTTPIPSKYPLLPSPVMHPIKYPFIESIHYNGPIVNDQPSLQPLLNGPSSIPPLLNSHSAMQPLILTRTPIQMINQHNRSGNISMNEGPKHLVSNPHENVNVINPYQQNILIQKNLIQIPQYSTNLIRTQNNNQLFSPNNNEMLLRVEPQISQSSSLISSASERTIDSKNKDLNVTLNKNFSSSPSSQITEASSVLTTSSFRRSYSESEASNRTLQAFDKNVILPPPISEASSPRPVYLGSDNHQLASSKPSIIGGKDGFSMQNDSTYIIDPHSIHNFQTSQTSQRTISVTSVRSFQPNATHQSFQLYQTAPPVVSGLNSRTFYDNEDKNIGMPYMYDYNISQNLGPRMPIRPTEKEIVENAKNHFISKGSTNNERLNDISLLHTHLIPISSTGAPFIYSKECLISTSEISRINDSLNYTKQTIPIGKNGGYLTQPILLTDISPSPETDTHTRLQKIDSMNTTEQNMPSISVLYPSAANSNCLETEASLIPSPSTSPRPSTLYSPNLSPVTQRRASREHVINFSSASNWLKSLRLHKYEDKFTNYTFQMIAELEDEELIELGLTKGAATKLRQHIDLLKSKGLKEFGQGNYFTTDLLLLQSSQDIDSPSHSLSPLRKNNQPNEYIYTQSLSEDTSSSSWSSSEVSAKLATSTGYSNTIVTSSNDGRLAPSILLKPSNERHTAANIPVTTIQERHLIANEIFTDTRLNFLPLSQNTYLNPPRHLPNNVVRHPNNILMQSNGPIAMGNSHIYSELDDDNVFDISGGSLQRRSSLISSCYNCGSNGHYGDECVEQTMEAQTYNRYAFHLDYQNIATDDLIPRKKPIAVLPPR